MKRLTSLFLLLFPFVCLANNWEVSDSMKTALNDAQVGDAKSILALKITDNIVRDNPDPNLIEVRKYIEIAYNNAMSDSLQLSSSVSMACLLMSEGKTKEGMDLVNKIVHICEKLQKTITAPYLGETIYYLGGDGVSMGEAISFQLALLDLWKASNNDLMLAYNYQRVGYMFREQKLYEEAIDFFHKSVSMAENIEAKNAPYIDQWSTHYIGSTYRRMGDWENSIKWNTISLKKASQLEKASNRFSSSGFALSELGITQLEMGNYREALNLQMESIRYNHMGKLVSWGLGWNTIQISNCYLALGKLDSAQLYCDSSIYYCSASLNFSPEVQNLRQLQSDLAFAKKDYQGAYLLHMEYLEIQDSLTNSKSANSLGSSITDYNYNEKRKLEQEIQSRRDQLVEEEQSRKNLLLTFAFVLGGLLLFIAIFIKRKLSQTKKQKDVIATQKNMVESQKEEIEEAHQEITDSIQYAKRIQTAILPPPKLVKEFLNDSFILYKPKDIVAGDFYWLEPQEGRVLFAAADCTGHGVPGAMVSVVCNNSLNRSVREFGLVEPGTILDKTRELVIQEFEKSEEEVKDGMDIALCSLEGHQLKYAGAHNPLWIIRKGASEIEEIKADKQPIGKFAVTKAFNTHSVQLNAGDTFYTFSDGYADQFGGEKGKKFKAKNFKALLLSIQHENMERQNELIDEAFENWRGNLEQLDDVCVIGVRV